MYRLRPASACPASGGRPGRAAASVAAAGNAKGTVSGAFDVYSDVLEGLAEWTGLEPATSGVTGQHSNRLNYHSAVLTFSPERSCGPPGPNILAQDADETEALSEPPALVGAEGFEPPTLSV